MTLEIICPSTGGHKEAVESWKSNASAKIPVSIAGATKGEAAGFLAKCDKGWRNSTADIMGYLHNDLYVHEKDWDRRVLAEFEDPEVAVVGFVGATELAHQDLYKIPYHFTQLARGGVWSNLTDAEVHGGKETGSKDVAVLDSCAVFVRRDLLVRIGGWPIARYPNSSHCSDLWICCMAARHNLRVRMVGVSCTHKSGGKGEAGSKWLEERGGDTYLHRQAHELIYKNFRDVLPLRVK